MSRLEIFRLGKNKKYDLDGIDIPKDGKNYSSNVTKGCDDWCSFSFRTLTPTVTDVKFMHRGCVLSRAAIVAIIEAIHDKLIEEATHILIDFRRMFYENKVPQGLPSNLVVFSKYCKYPSRRNCILMGCETILKILLSNSACS